MDFERAFDVLSKSTPDDKAFGSLWNAGSFWHCPDGARAYALCRPFIEARELLIVQ
jgi:hypothetical protein